MQPLAGVRYCLLQKQYTYVKVNIVRYWVINNVFLASSFLFFCVLILSLPAILHWKHCVYRRSFSSLCKHIGVPTIYRQGFSIQTCWGNFLKLNHCICKCGGKACGHRLIFIFIRIFISAFGDAGLQNPSALKLRVHTLLLLCMSCLYFHLKFFLPYHRNFKKVSTF